MVRSCSLRILTICSLTKHHTCPHYTFGVLAASGSKLRIKQLLISVLQERNRHVPAWSPRTNSPSAVVLETDEVRTVQKYPVTSLSYSVFSIKLFEIRGCELKFRSLHPYISQITFRSHDTFMWLSEVCFTCCAITNPMQEVTEDKLIVSRYSRNLTHFTEPDGSLPCTQQPATCPYPKPHTVTLYPTTILR